MSLYVKVNGSGTGSGGGGGSDGGVTTLAPVGAVPNANGGIISGSILTLEPANTSFPGVLTAADWNTFNNKQPTGSYITSLTGPITASGPGAAAVSITSQTGTGTTFAMQTDPTFLGQTGFLAAAPSTSQVAVNGASTLSGTSQYAFNADYTPSTASTVSAAGFRSVLNTPASATVFSRLSNFHSVAPTLGAASSITNYIGFYDSGTASLRATNNAVLSDTPGSVGNFFIYNGASNPSVFTGAISGGTGAASSLILESTTGTGTSDTIIFKTGSQVEAARFDTVGGLRIGRTGTSGAGTESLTILSSQVSGSNTPNGQRTDLVITGDTVNSGGGNALSIGVTRTITTTAPIDTAALAALSINSLVLNVPTGVLTNNSSAGYRAIGINWSGAVTSGSGTISFSQWTGMTFGASTANTGATKTGIKFAAISGATNNAYIADNAFTGSYFISSTTAQASTFGGPIAHTAYATSTATSGTITIATLKPGLMINSAGGTTLTIQLPASPIDGQECWVGSVGNFTTVTWQDAGGTGGNVVGGQASIGGTARGQTFRYISSITKWLAV